MIDEADVEKRLCFPVAVADGDTTDGLNMDEVPEHKKGVTCYFCHNMESIGGKENNPLIHNSISTGSTRS